MKGDGLEGGREEKNGKEGGVNKERRREWKR